MKPLPRALLLVLALLLVTELSVRAEDAPAQPSSSALGDEAILGRSSSALRIQSVTTRVTSFDQYGTGYQSQAGPLPGPGSERTTIFEPVAEVVATQGKRLTHRFFVPVDVVTAASADAIDRHRKPPDVLSSASRVNFAGSFDWTATYHADANSDVSVRSGVHLEEPFRSWNGGLSTTRTLADGDATVSLGLLEVFDWFDHFDILGFRSGRTDRSSTTATIGLSQILTTTTLVNVNYGLTVQEGELGNTWNVVPLENRKLGPELLPKERVRHALVARASQFLPWDGALHVYYRLYRDDWGLSAHSAEAELRQRILPMLYLGALYRYHTQTGVDFFTTRAPLDARHRTADSDLAPFHAQTIGGKLVMDVPVDAGFRVLHFDLGYERYFRSNDLQMNVFTCATGYRF
jgi:hypothetical protein